MSSKARWLVGIAVVLAAGGIGYLAQRWSAGRDAPIGVTTAQVSPGSAADEDEADAPAAPTSSPVPETLPDFQLTDRDGKPRRLSDWSGRPVLVNFWATWCPPCRREIPLLNRTRVERADQKLEIVGIAVDFRDDVLAYVKTQPVEYPLLIGEEDGVEAVKSFGMQAAFPFSIFADSRHRIVTVKIGELHAEELTLILDTIRELDAGSIEMPAAKSRITEGMQAISLARAGHDGHG